MLVVKCQFSKIAILIDVVGMAKDLGFSKGDKLYFSMPGLLLEDGIDEIHDDKPIAYMLSVANPRLPLEIYIQHAQSGNASVAQTHVDLNIDENMDSKKKCRMSTKKRDERVWTAEEEALLVDILYELNNTGWKVDTGHKSGYLSHVEKEMVKKMPSTDLRVDPHIRSKVKVLKKQLSYILDIQQYGSGFGWDDEKKIVTGDEEIFMGWAKSRDGGSTLWTKPMFYYDELVKIYANDLAKGSKVKGPGDQLDMDEDIVSGIEVGNQTMDESASQPRGSTPISSKSSLKRKSCDSDGLELEFIDISKSIKSYLEADKGVGLQTGDKRKQLYEVLRMFPGLSSEQVVKAIRLIGQDTAKIDLFFGLSDDLKLIFVRQEIDGPN